MSDKHDPSDGTPHIQVTVYSTPVRMKSGRLLIILTYSSIPVATARPS